MKTLTQEELEKRMKHWISNRDEILDFYVKLADEPAKRMIERLCLIPLSSFSFCLLLIYFRRPECQQI